MEVFNDSRCFVCGPENPSGLNVFFSVDKENARASASLTIPEKFQGWQGVVHGGIVAALLDEVGIYACRARGEQFVTAELNVKYRTPVPVDAVIQLDADLVSQKRKIFMVAARLSVDGKVFAEAASKVFSLDR